MLLSPTCRSINFLSATEKKKTSLFAQTPSRHRKRADKTNIILNERAVFGNTTFLSLTLMFDEIIIDSMNVSSCLKSNENSDRIKNRFAQYNEMNGYCKDLVRDGCVIKDNTWANKD